MRLAERSEREMFRAQLAEKPAPVLLDFRAFCLRGETEVETGRRSAADSATAEAESMHNQGDTG